MRRVNIGRSSRHRGRWRETRRQTDGDQMQSRRTRFSGRRSRQTQLRRGGEEKTGAGGGDGDQMSVDAVRPRNGGDMNDILEVGTVRPRVDGR